MVIFRRAAGGFISPPKHPDQHGVFQAPKGKGNVHPRRGHEGPERE